MPAMVGDTEAPVRIREERLTCFVCAALGAGIMGGEKFKAGNVFFKFARDDKGIFNSDALAHKVRVLIATMDTSICDPISPSYAIQAAKFATLYTSSCNPMSHHTRFGAHERVFPVLVTG